MEYEFSDQNNNTSKSMMIFNCGYGKYDARHFFGPAVRSHYILQFAISGKGYYHVNNRNYTVNTGDVFLIRPGESTYYRADKFDPWECIWVSFSGIEAPDLIKKIGLESKYCVSVKDRETFRHNLEQILNQLKTGAESEFLILSYFYSAMSCLEEPEKSADTEKEHISKAILYIHNNFSYPIKVSDIAGYIGIDRSYLYKLFMSSKGISPKQYLLNVRINAAKSMLMTGQYSVTEVALSCGFSDPPLFCNSFRKFTGLTPSQFAADFSCHSSKRINLKDI